MRMPTLSLALSMAMLASLAGQADAQPRRAAAATDDGQGTTQCAIERIAMARGGAALLCGGTLYAFNGGTTPGGISAFMSWALDAQARQTSARNTITIEHGPADAAHQAICADINMPSPSNRQPISCRAIRATYR